MFLFGPQMGNMRRSKNPLAWISTIFYLYSLQDTSWSYRDNTNDILRLNIPSPTEYINTNTICGNTAGLSRKQYQLCIKEPAATASAIQGLQIALHECKRQFKGNRWNCSSLETRNKMPYTSPFFRTGFREAAFFHALSSAGVSYAVAHACSLGKIEGCECASKRHMNELAESVHKNVLQNGGDLSDIDAAMLQYKWGSCDHNINLGMKLSRKFLDERESTKDFYARLMMHNNRVGRLIVANNMAKRCSCHGTSGSCSLKTCWQEAPSMESVGNILKRLYESAQKITHNNRVDQNSAAVDSTRRYMGNDIPYTTNKKNWSRNFSRRYGLGFNSLVYWNDSPDYCEKDPSIQFAGTRGRFCSKHGNSHKSSACSNLCCNRGHKTSRLARVEKCKCQFHWCCHVECNNCTIVEKVSVCK